MRKLMWVFVLAVGLGLSLASAVFAEEMQGMEMDMPQGQGQQGQGMMMGGGPGKGQHGMGMMQKDSMIATSDGGIVLKQGPRLIKYDKDLTLVKEVEIPRGKPPVAQGVKSESANTEVEVPVETASETTPQ